MCEFVEDTPESYDDVMTSGLNSDIKKMCFTFLSTILHTIHCIILLFYFLLILLNIVDTSDNYEQVRSTEPHVFTLFMFT